LVFFFIVVLCFYLVAEFMNHPKRRTILLALLSFCLVVGAQAQRGAQTKLRGLDELTSEATQIVRGTVVSAHVEPHPTYTNLMTVVVKFRVDKTIKGAAGKQLEFRQFVWDVRDFKDDAIYRRGDSMVLLLGTVSPNGLRSPVGLGQGRFRIQKDAAGQQIALNESGNVGLFRTTSAQTIASQMRLSAHAMQMAKENRGGPMRLDDLETVIQGFAAKAPARSAQ
jgi:hypothetical protein